jgi:5-methylcytosine-specific restriction endonuclease McrA/uncharacterized C2H2 Zn-finger protein
MEDHYSRECSKCGKMLVTPWYRVVHESKCDGSHAKQCPRCWKEFPNRAGKSRHLAKGTCVAAPKPPPLPKPPAAPIDSNIIDKPPPLPSYPNTLDFDKTSTTAVIAYLKDTPEAQTRLRSAFEAGCLHQELTRVTHFTGPAENRNVVSIEPHGSTAKVIYGNKSIKTDASETIQDITARNIRIANCPEVREMIGATDPEDGDVLSEATTVRQRSYESRRIRLVLENGGDYVLSARRPPPTISTPPGRKAWSTCVRNAVAAGQGWQCNMCNDMLPPSYDLDHMIPLFKGGSDAIANLQALCVPCHRAKSAGERTTAMA